jgi:pilus assembly protein CpaE
MSGAVWRALPPAIRGSRGWRDVRGQAAVEVVALLPLVAAIALAILQALAAGRAEVLAGHAAQSGAVALAEGRDAAAAARAAVPDEARGRLAVVVHGSRVQVRLTPATLIPGAAGLLTATATADAGPVA